MKSLLGRLWKGFRSHASRRLMGQDLEGNRFYESYLGADQRPKRTVEYVTGNDAADAANRLTQLPVQWFAWLSYSRMYPPTIEELQKEKSRLDVLAINVARLKQTDEAERQRQQAHLEVVQLSPSPSSPSMPESSAIHQHPQAPPSRPIGPTAEPQPWNPRPAHRH